MREISTHLSCEEGKKGRKVNGEETYFKRLERRIINELGLLDNIESNFRTVLKSLGGVTPVEKMIIVHHSTTEVGHTQDGDVLREVVISFGPDQSITET